MSQGNDLSGCAVMQQESAESASSPQAWLEDYLRRELGVTVSKAGVVLSVAEMGFDSLEVERLRLAVQERFAITLDVQALVRCESLADVASLIASPHAEHAEVERPEVTSTTLYERAVNPTLGGRLRGLRLDKTFKSGKGSYLQDESGRSYLDFLASYGALPFGHNPDCIWSAIQDFGERGEPCFAQLSAPAAAAELASVLVSIAPKGMQFATFQNSGAEAVEVALKMARAATGRPGILATRNSFHGKTLGALSATGNPHFQSDFFAPVEHFRFVDFGELDQLAHALRRDPDYFAAFIVEPIQGEGGIVEPPPEYLIQAQELCRAAGVLFVVDEVQTGLGRTGALFASEELGLSPDILVLAKALGGGVVPIGAVLGTRFAFSDAFNLKHSSTFGGNGLACRVGLASLNALLAEDGALLLSVRRNGAALRRGLERLQLRYPKVLSEVRGRGYMLGVRFASCATEPLTSLFDVVKAQGLLCPLIASYMLNVERVRVAPTLNGSDVLRIMPPLTAGQAECELFLSAFERVLSIVNEQNAGLLWQGIQATSPAESRRPTSEQSRPRRSRRTRFAFLVHPPTTHELRHFDATLQELGPHEFQKLTELARDTIEPFVCDHLTVTINGDGASGDIIMVPCTADELSAMPEADAVRLVAAAVDLARARGAQLVGLGAYTSIVTRGGAAVANRGIAVTNGNAYTAVHAARNVHTALRAKHHGTAPTVAVLGAGGSVGGALAMLLAEIAQRLVLIGNPTRSVAAMRAQLQSCVGSISGFLNASNGKAPFQGEFASRLRVHGALNEAGLARAVAALEESGHLLLTQSARGVVSIAHAVVCATNSRSLLLQSQDFRRGAVVCDLSQPPNFPAETYERRPDLVPLDGGLVRVPAPVNLASLGLDESHVYACMAETLLLALSGQSEHFSLGTTIAADQLHRIRALGEEYGFDRERPRELGRSVASIQPFLEGSMS